MLNKAFLAIMVFIFILVTCLVFIFMPHFVRFFLTRPEALVVLAVYSFVAVGLAVVGLRDGQLKEFSYMAFCGFVMYWVGFFLILFSRPQGEFGLGFIAVGLLFTGIPGVILMLVSTVSLTYYKMRRKGGFNPEAQHLEVKK